MAKDNLPQHLAIIMDGNGRWAKQRGLPRTEGHKQGVKRVKEIVTYCRKQEIRYLTLYTFSKENWKRPQLEIKTLFELLATHLQAEALNLVEQNIKLNVLGDLEELPLATRQVVQHVLKKTQNCTQMVLNLALNYSGRAEIVRACQLIQKKGIPPEQIDEELIKKHLYTADQPDPDLIIRTSGEMRLSNFLIFQAAYAELYFTPVFWPDFGQQELEKALKDFAGRERKFGGLNSC